MASTNDPSDRDAQAVGDLGEPLFAVGEGLDLSPEPDSRLEMVEDRWWDSQSDPERTVPRNRKIEVEPEAQEAAEFSERDASPGLAEPSPLVGSPQLPTTALGEGDTTFPAPAETPGTERFPWDEIEKSEGGKSAASMSTDAVDATLAGEEASGAGPSPQERESAGANAGTGIASGENLPSFLVSTELPATSPDPSTKVPDPEAKNSPADNSLDLDAIAAQLPTGNLEGALIKPKAKAGCWTMFATLFFIFTMVVLVGLVGGAAFLWFKAKDFEASITAAARDQLAERGLFFDYEGWRYRFPRGIVLTNVSVYAQPNPDVVALTATDIGVNIDLWTLLESGGLDGTAELNFSDTELVLFDGGQEVTRLAGVDAEIFMSPEEVLVERFAAGWSGVRLRGSGRIGLSPEGGADLTAAEPAGSPTGTTSPGTTSPGVFGIPLATLAAIQKVMAVESEGDVPSLDLEFSVESGQADSLLLAASLTGREFRWHGVTCNSLVAHATYVAADGILEIDSFQSTHGEGQISGTLSYYTATSEINLAQIQSNVDPLLILSEYDPALAVPYAGISFQEAPSLLLSGTIPLDAPKRSKLTIACQRLVGVTWKKESRSITIRDLRGTGILSDGTLEMDEIAATIWEGTALVKGTLRVVDPELPFSGLIDVKGASLSDFAESFGSLQEGLAGEMDVNFRGVGYRDPAKIRGGGQVEIRKAALGTFPAVGPVQAALGRILPAFSFTGEGTLRGAYIVEAGVLVTSDLKVENESAQLSLNGSLNLSKQETDFTVVAQLQAPLAAATGLVDKAIKVTGKGPLGSPTLKIKEFPLEFAGEGLGAVLGTTPETLALLEETLGNAEAASAVLSDQLESAVGLELGSEIRGLLNRLGGAVGSEGASVPAAPASTTGGN